MAPQGRDRGPRGRVGSAGVGGGVRLSSCCDPSGYADVFDDKQARKDLRTYRRKGLDGLTAVLLGQLRPGAGGATVLEVGGGIGAVQAELLEAGAVSSVNVEISAGYEEAAKELAVARGTADSVRRVVGDFVAEADSLAAADIVILNKVVCCYPDMTAMVGAAADKATKTLAMVVPRDRWFMRVLRRYFAIIMRLRRNSFRFYVHDPSRIVANASARGLSLVFSSQTLGWQAVVLERIQAATGSRGPLDHSGPG